MRIKKNSFFTIKPERKSKESLLGYTDQEKVYILHEDTLEGFKWNKSLLFSTEYDYETDKDGLVHFVKQKKRR